MNSFQDAPLNNVKNIRKQAARANVEVHPKVREAFANFLPKGGSEKAALTGTSLAKTSPPVDTKPT